MKITSTLALAILLGACVQQVNKVPVATSGSKADGSVDMSYQVFRFEAPVVDWNAALRKAAKRCESWGYSKAEGFEGTVSSCQAYNGYGTCVHAIVTRTYQCVD